MLTVNEFRKNYDSIKHNKELNKEIAVESAIEYLSSKFPETSSVFSRFDDLAIEQVN